MRHLLLTCSLALALPAGAQNVLPRLSGERTDGSTVELPTASQGRFLIVALAFGQKAGPLLEDWCGPAYLRFVAKHGIFASQVDADVYFVPLFVGLNKSAYNSSLKRLREEADPEVARHVVFVKEDAEAVRDALGLKDREVPYILVVDPQGRIIHREQGAYSDDKLDAIESAVTD